MGDASQNPLGAIAERRPAVLCPNCMTANDEHLHFCKQCAAPLTAHAAIDPYGQIWAAGHVYQKAADRPTKFIIVLGMWLIFASLAVVAVLTAIDLATYLFVERRNSFTYFGSHDVLIEELIAFLISWLSLALYGAILFKVTRNYIRLKHSDTFESIPCRECGYDLRGNPTAANCPECGCATRIEDVDGVIDEVDDES